MPNTPRVLMIAGLALVGLLVFFILFGKKNQAQSQQTNGTSANPSATAAPIYLSSGPTVADYTETLNNSGNTISGGTNTFPGNRNNWPPPVVPPIHTGPPGGIHPPPPPPPRNTVYTVRPGDDLSIIAAKYHSSWQAIYQANQQAIDSYAKSRGQSGRNAHPWDYIYVGQRLNVPLS